MEIMLEENVLINSDNVMALHTHFMTVYLVLATVHHAIFLPQSAASQYPDI